MRLRKLIERLPDQRDLRDARGQTALAVVVLSGRHSAAEILLEGGAEVNAPIRFVANARPNVGGLERAQKPELADGSTPLIMARDAAMAALLLRHGADTRAKNSYGWSALFHFTHHGTVAMLESLLSAGAPIDGTANLISPHPIFCHDHAITSRPKRCRSIEPRTAAQAGR